MSYNFTQSQREEILTVALKAFSSQRGVTLDPQGFEIHVDKPNDCSLCSLMLTTIRVDDNFRIKLYVRGFEDVTQVETYKLLQEQNYGPGAYDEVFVTNTKLSSTTFSAFYRYLLSDEFQEDVINATDKLVLEGSEDGDALLLEDGSGYLVLEY